MVTKPLYSSNDVFLSKSNGHVPWLRRLTLPATSSSGDDQFSGNPGMYWTGADGPPFTLKEPLASRVAM